MNQYRDHMGLANCALGVSMTPHIDIDRVENGWLVHYQDKGQQFVFTRVSDMVDHLRGAYGHFDIDADAPELPFDKAITPGEAFAHRSTEAETDGDNPPLTKLQDARAKIVLDKPRSGDVWRQELDAYGGRTLRDLDHAARNAVLLACELRLGIRTNQAWPTGPSPEDKEQG